MGMLESTTPNPRRVAAGKRNYEKRRGFTPEGLARLREAALASRPWLLSRGPVTAEGKARSAANAKVLQKGARSRRERSADLAEYRNLIAGMQAGRRRLEAGGVS